MAHELSSLEPGKTYASEANARKAVEKLGLPDNVRYKIFYTEEGRAYPVFFGMEAAAHQLWFCGFIVIC